MLKLLPRRARLSLAAVALAAALAPLAAHAEGDTVETDVAPSTPTLAQSVGATVQSATDRLVQTTRNVTESALDLIESFRCARKLAIPENAKAHGGCALVHFTE